MFGYVRPCKGMLRICEYETYKSVYCGLCRTLGQLYGPLARLLLSNDLTFLALLRLSLTETEPSAASHRCFLHPLQKQLCIMDSPQLAYAAAATVLLGYHKLTDVLTDNEPFHKKLAARLMRPLLFLSYRKAKRLYPHAERVCQDALTAQRRLEREHCGSLDAACAPTAQGLSLLLTADLQLPQAQLRVLSRLGYLMGRYIYLCDAAADWMSDKAKNNYNPLLYRSPAAASLDTEGHDDNPAPAKVHARHNVTQIGKLCRASSSHDLPTSFTVTPKADLHDHSSQSVDLHSQLNVTLNQDQNRHPAQDALYLTLGEVEKTFFLLRVNRFSPILENILLLGLRQTADGILLQRSENHDGSL